MSLDSLRLAAVEANVRRIPTPQIEPSGPIFLQTAVKVQAETTNEIPWRTFNAAQFIPDGVRTAIVETEWSISAPDSGDKDARIWFRRNLDAIQVLGSRGRASGNSDNIAGSNQVMVPVSANRSFDFMIETPGFNNGAQIRLIGYFR